MYTYIDWPPDERRMAVHDNELNGKSVSQNVQIRSMRGTMCVPIGAIPKTKIKRERTRLRFHIAKTRNAKTKCVPQKPTERYGQFCYEPAT